LWQTQGNQFSRIHSHSLLRGETRRGIATAAGSATFCPTRNWRLLSFDAAATKKQTCVKSKWWSEK
jgi:hypothetical protein